MKDLQHKRIVEIDGNLFSIDRTFDDSAAIYNARNVELLNHYLDQESQSESSCQVEMPDGAFVCILRPYKPNTVKYTLFSNIRNREVFIMQMHPGYSSVKSVVEGFGFGKKDFQFMDISDDKGYWVFKLDMEKAHLEEVEILEAWFIDGIEPIQKNLYEFYSSGYGTWKDNKCFVKLSQSGLE